MLWPAREKRAAAGVRRIASSDPEARMLVSFLVLHALTSMSFSLLFSPMIMPSYTGTPDPMKSVPRSCKLSRAYALDVPALHGHQYAPVTRREAPPCAARIPRSTGSGCRCPRVSVRNSPLKPIRPRDGTFISRRVYPSLPWFMLRSSPLLFPSFSMTTPENSSLTSMMATSIGSCLTPLTSL